MCVKKLSKVEALELITPVIDGEVTPLERQSFFASLDYYPIVRKQFRSANCIKKLMQTRCPKAKAPLLLCERIQALIDDDLYGHTQIRP